MTQEYHFTCIILKPNMRDTIHFSQHTQKIVDLASNTSRATCLYGKYKSLNLDTLLDDIIECSIKPSIHSYVYSDYRTRYKPILYKIELTEGSPAIRLFEDDINALLPSMFETFMDYESQLLPLLSRVPDNKYIHAITSDKTGDTVHQLVKVRTEEGKYIYSHGVNEEVYLYFTESHHESTAKAIEQMCLSMFDTSSLEVCTI